MCFHIFDNNSWSAVKFMVKARLITPETRRPWRQIPLNEEQLIMPRETVDFVELIPV